MDPAGKTVVGLAIMLFCLALATPALGEDSENSYTPLLSVPRVRNQCSMNHCWLMSWLGEREINQSPTLGNTALSAAFVFAHHLRDQIEERFSEKPLDIEEGGSYELAEELVETHGIVPEEAWQPTVPFSEWHERGLVAELNNTLSNWRGVYLSLDIPWERKKELREIYHAEAIAILNKFSGPLPTSFTYRGQITNPLAFAKQSGVLPQSPTRLIVRVRHPNAEIKKLLGKELSAKDVDHLKEFLDEQSWPLWKKRISAGKMTLVLDSAAGVVHALEERLESGKAAAIGLQLYDMDREEAVIGGNANTVGEKLWDSDRGHGVVIYGMSRKRSCVTGWRLLDSQGTQAGQEGSRHLTASFLKRAILSLALTGK